MIEGLEQLPERVAAVERKIDVLTTRVDVLSTRVDLLSAREEERYQQTAAAFAEQRSYTDAGFARMETRFAHIDSRFVVVEGRFDRLERKLDGFIDAQTRANEIAERRLRRLEARG